MGTRKTNNRTLAGCVSEVRLRCSMGDNNRMVSGNNTTKHIQKYKKQKHCDNSFNCTACKPKEKDI